jgi:hypothetical protein
VSGDDASWPPRPRFGDRSVALAADHRGFVVQSIRSLAVLPEDLPRHALVGGLAVMVRLYEAHRATIDFDEVTEGKESTIALLVAEGARRTANGVYLPDRGVQLDLLDAETDTATLEALAAELTDEDERRALQLAFVCRHALETAVPTDIIALEGDDIAAKVSLPVATAGALVAMKVHAAVAPDRAPPKAAGDLYDAYRLVRAWGPSVVAEDLSRAPVAMLHCTAAQIRRIFDEDADRTAHRLRSASTVGVDSVDVEDLAAAATVASLLDAFALHDDADDLDRARVRRTRS